MNLAGSGSTGRASAEGNTVRNTRIFDAGQGYGSVTDLLTFTDACVVSRAGRWQMDPDAVWDELLENSRPLTSIVGVRAETDPARRTLAVSGQWWYRGEYTVSNTEHGSLLTYRMYNIAPRFSRWLVPLVAGRALRSSAQSMIQRQLSEIGKRLSTRAYLVH